jgi:hypothetical protein
MKLSFGETVDPEGKKSAARWSEEKTHGPNCRAVRAVDEAHDLEDLSLLKY